jgi:hypothetical protein
MVARNRPTPTIQVSSRGYLKAAWEKIRSMCRRTVTSMSVAPQWWMLRMSQPKSTTLVTYFTLS